MGASPGNGLRYVGEYSVRRLKVRVIDIGADDTDVTIGLATASFEYLERCMDTTGAMALASGERHEIEDGLNG